ncbi:MAG: sigma-70 family RNA polymerase sigma factor [Steroidobacteraceae bacterium]
MYVTPLPISAINPDGGPTQNRQAVTRLLSAWRAGDNNALQQLTPLVYEELRLLAHRYMRRERSSHTLQATAVVHEAFVRMVDLNVAWQDRTHFYAVAATLMRRILVDHAKSRLRAKRGGSAHIHSLDAYDFPPVAAGPYDVLDIDETLNQLAQVDTRLARTVEWHYFGGLTCPEIAAMQGISEATVHRDLRLAKAWMLKELRPNTAGAPA